MLETDQRPKAQELWNSIIQDYPDSPESTQAKEQLKKIRVVLILCDSALLFFHTNRLVLGIPCFRL